MEVPEDEEGEEREDEYGMNYCCEIDHWVDSESNSVPLGKHAIPGENIFRLKEFKEQGEYFSRSRETGNEGLILKLKLMFFQNSVSFAKTIQFRNSH